MKLEVVTNKFLIKVVRQLKSMRSTYSRYHQHEIPVGNPIEKNIKNICCQLAKFNRIVLKRKRNDSLDVEIKKTNKSYRESRAETERRYGGN
jgi:hypothetical protein